MSRLKKHLIKDDGKITLAQKIAERIANSIGVKFLIIQTLAIIAWMLWNSLPWFPHFDPYPFILMNLTLSLQAAYTGPVLLIANKRNERLAQKIADDTHQKAYLTYVMIKEAHDTHLEDLAEEHSKQLDKIHEVLGKRANEMKVDKQ